MTLVGLNAEAFERNAFRLCDYWFPRATLDSFIRGDRHPEVVTTKVRRANG